MRVKSSRSAIVWSIALISLPWLTIPLYWILGKSKFEGYSEIPKTAYAEHQEIVRLAYDEILKPADSLQACSLFFLNLINQTKERLWIASPYFVPDGSTLNALKLAAIRGVDVEEMLQRDLATSRQVDLLTYQKKPFWFKLAARVSRPLAPIL